MQIREANLADWPRIKEIYIDGINTKRATFETEDQIKSGEDWFASKIKGSVFVAEIENKVMAWVILSPVSNRCVYSGVAEVSVYVDPKAKGKGLGTTLLNKAIDFADTNNIWTIEANMFTTNEASKHTHQKVGFKILGVREKLGKLEDEWIDILMMERRSEKIF